MVAVPTLVPFPCKAMVTAVAFGANHALCLEGSTGAVWAWGSNRNGQLGMALTDDDDDDDDHKGDENGDGNRSGTGTGSGTGGNGRSGRSRVSAMESPAPRRLFFFVAGGDDPITSAKAASKGQGGLVDAADVHSRHGRSYDDVDVKAKRVARGERAVAIGCCENYSAAVTSHGRLFTWGEGGCLGHAPSSSPASRASYLSPKQQRQAQQEKRTAQRRRHVRAGDVPVPTLVQGDMGGREVVTGIGLGSLYMGCVTASG